jgi:peptidoglycan/xylan/chitin deacetylase (PgdA/CDA1 family)
MLSITIDDPNTEPSSIMAWFETDDAILNTLSKNNLQAALFVCGKRVDNADGKVLLEKWDSAGHMICNHSYSHHYFHSKKIPLEEFEKDMIVNDSLIKPYGNYTKLFRYPYLKEGNTSEKRDGFRKFLDSMGYGNGFVTIDASDWYISSRLNDTLKYDQNADKSPFRQFYLDHIFERASFYDSLALLLTGRHIKHTLLLHHNLINALFLEDLIMMFKEKGWEFVNANDAFSDDIGRTKPDILPAGESLIWALAKESVKYNDILRYPGEDADYEKEKLDFYIKRSVKP